MRYSDPGDWAEYERWLSSDGEDSPTAMKLWNLIQRRFEEHLWFGRLIARVVRGHHPFAEIRHKQFESGSFDYSASTFVDIGKEAVPVRIWRGSDITSRQNGVTSGSTIRTPGASQSLHLSGAQTIGSTQQPRSSGAELERQLGEWIDEKRQSGDFPAKYKAEIELAKATGASRASIRKAYDSRIPEAQRRVGPKKKSAF